MIKKPTYEELEARIRQLENAVVSQDNSNDNGIIKILSESYQQLADHSQDAIYLYDIESGTFPFFNKRFRELYEIKQGEQIVLSPSSVSKYIHPDDIGQLRDARKNTLKTGGQQGEVEYRYIETDGTTRWLHDRWSVIRNSSGRAVAIEGFIRDNTQRKQAEDELKHIRQNALIGSYILQDRCFQYVNPEFCRITGYSEQELLGMPSINLVHSDDRKAVEKNAKRMLTGTKITPYEFQIIDRHGRAKWVMETVTPVKYNGCRAALGCFMDITKQKQIAEEHREKAQLKAILEMAGAVSHELNNPLQVLLIGVEKLDADNLDPSRKKELLKLVREHTERIIELSSKIRKISQYASKDYVDGRKIFDIDAASKSVSQ